MPSLASLTWNIELSVLNAAWYVPGANLLELLVALDDTFAELEDTLAELADVLEVEELAFDDWPPDPHPARTSIKAAAIATMDTARTVRILSPYLSHVPM